MFHGNPEVVAIAIMAKAPVPGLAKTRLAAKLGATGAAQFQANCIRRMTQVAVDAAIGPVTLWATPDTTHPVFVTLAARLPIALKRQSDGDLGSRMLYAMQDAAGPTLVIGVDCPNLDAAHLRQAAACLQAGRDAVLIPVEDGGYVLIGARAPQPSLFDNMEWGGESVSAETRRRLTQSNLTWEEPALLFDIDEPRDLDRLTPEQASALLGEFRAATASK